LPGTSRDHHCSVPIGVAMAVCRGGAGIPTGMMVFDIAGAPFRWGAALRRRRLFHPVGILAHGSLERLAPARVGLPVESTPMVGRVSTALGLPGSLPA